MMSIWSFLGLVNIQAKKDDFVWSLFLFNLANNDSWFEVYKLTKEQWKSELAAQEQVRRFWSNRYNDLQLIGDGCC